MAFTHNNKLAEDEPKWGDVDKTRLPRVAFAERGEAGKKTTWGYPHHWVKGGGDLDEDGVYTTGTMYLHEGGLNAAWAVAQGARTGRKAEAHVIEHLQSHREALGKSIDKDSVRYLLVPDASLVAKALPQGPGTGDDPGWVEGYAAVWDNIDLAGEVIRKGAFQKSISEVVPAGKVKLMSQHFCHGGDVAQCIGTVTEAKEDDKGLHFHAVFSSVPLAQETRVKVLEGHVKGCSVGFRVIKHGWVQVEGKSVLELQECALAEVTLTVKPVNELALITAAKNLQATSAPESPLGRLHPEALREVGQAMGSLSQNILRLFAEPESTVGKAAELHSLRREVRRMQLRLMGYVVGENRKENAS